VQELINRGANIEACVLHGNTPFLIAASAGFIPMLKVLVAAGARIHAKNYAGVGARGRCVQSSSTTNAYLESLGVRSSWRNYPPDAVRGKSNGASQRARMARTKAFLNMEKWDNRV
jgi:ankyrin repeat protein